MLNLASALQPSLVAADAPSGFGVLRWLREQVSYRRSMRALNRLEPRTLDDIGISPDQFHVLARRHARGLPPIERSTGG
jgi:uncharacterized protein YjiS (DUF1127 family)